MKSSLNVLSLCFISMLFLLISCSKETADSNFFPDGISPLSNSAEVFSSSGSGEGYNEIEENPWVFTSEEEISTFSIDADGASYSNVRRFINNGELPPTDAIRTEELINYFIMDYEFPFGDDPIALNAEMADCPWAKGHHLLRIGIQGKKILTRELPATNFVFLIDVSGSMKNTNKLELLKQGFLLFTDQMDADDRIAIVTYAGKDQVVLSSTSGDDKETIRAAIQALEAGGGTAGARGIITAYEIAEANFIEGGNNRIVLGTDGDFNVGISSQEELITLIEEKRETGVFLTVLGVGTGNYQDGKMEQLANNGNGTFEYIDNYEQAEKVFLHEIGKFHTVAKDVKIQIEFDQNQVKAYRLIGYENRLLENPDFEDNTKDAGEIGANQNITAIYEINPTLLPLSTSQNFGNINFRYKQPDGSTSVLLNLKLNNNISSFNQSSENMRFAATVAGFGLMLRDSEYKGTLSWKNLSDWANSSVSFDPHGYRQEFIDLIEIARGL